MKECKYAKDYKGIYPPRCNGGNGCEKCHDIYRVAKAKREAAIHKFALRVREGGYR